MKKRNFFFLMISFFSLGYLQAAPPALPTTSEPGGDATWYYIEFSQRDWPSTSGNRYLYDVGDSYSLIAAPAVSGDDGILWKIETTEVSDEYRIVSKRGNAIDYTSPPLSEYVAGDRYYSSATSTARFKIETVNTDYYKLTRVGGSGIDKSGTSPFFDAYESGDGVSITFKSEITPATTDPSFAASNTTSLDFGKVTLNMEAEAKTLYLFAYNLTDNLTYSLSGTGSDKFSVTPQSPLASAGGVVAVPLKVTLAKLADAGDVSATLTITGGGISTPLELTLKATGEDTELPVTLSTEGSDVWYYIHYYKRSGLVLHDQSAGSNLVGAPATENEEGQLWKVVSTGINGKYKIINKLGRQITRTGSNFASTATDDYTFRFDKRSDGKWQIYCNETGGYINKANYNYIFTSYYHIPDDGSAVEFLLPAAVTFNFPKISTRDDEHWYQIQFNRRAGDNKVIQDSELGEELTQAVIASGQTSQYWKFTGKATDYQIESYAGHQIAKGGNNNYKAVAIGSGESHGAFKFFSNGATEYWKLWNNVMDRTGTTGTSTRYLNDDGATKVNLWSGDDAGNALNFLPVAAPPAEFSTGTSALSFETVALAVGEDRSLEVAGRNLSGTISWALSGDDASAFTVAAAEGWSAKRGGDLTITFTPTTVKAYSATLSIKTDGQTDIEVALSGTGSSDPILYATPASLDFGDVTTDLNSETKEIAVSIAYGKADIAYAKTGTDADAFTITESSWTAAAGGTLNVVFKPTDVKVYSASIEITSEDAEKKTVSLTGKGVTTELPVTLSTESSDVWYYIEANKRSGQYYQDLGADKALEIRPAISGEDAQLWKVVSTGISGKYRLVSKTGNQIAYAATASGDIEADRFYTKAASENTYSFSKREDGNWQIRWNEGSTYINKAALTQQLSNTRFGKYSVIPDDGSSVIFVPAAEVEFRLPAFSTEIQTTWYYLNFKKHSANNIQGNGENADVTQVAKSETNANQLWKFTGTWDNAKIVDHRGLELKLVGSFYQLVASGTGDAYKLFWNNGANETGWRLINNSVAGGTNVLVNDNEGSRLGAWREDGNPGNTFDFVLAGTPLDFVIEATAEASAGDYNPAIFGDIVFKSTDAATGQLKDISAEGLQVNGVVKVEKTFTPAVDYSIGFPFAVPALPAGNYSLKSYNGTTNLFETASAIEAGAGYLIRFTAPEEAPETEATVTFTSASSPVLSATSASVADGYKLTANPLVTNLTQVFGGAEAIYPYDYATAAFVLLSQDASFTLKPFEALVSVKGVTGSLYANIGTGTGTNPGAIDANDPPVSVKYYTLQGHELQQLSENGVYIVKKIYASQKVEVIKVLYKK